jgi:CYTH domain-containing protein
VGRVSDGYEIERRWLVRARPGLREELEGGWHLRQGYVRAEEPAVRIRSGEPRGPVLTCKAGRGVRRREAETVVSPEMAELLFEAAGERVLEKVRFRIGPWELDWFHGDLEGLVLLELELDEERDPVPDPPAGIQVLHEVTNHNTLVSADLAAMNSRERRALVRRVYAEAAE